MYIYIDSTLEIQLTHLFQGWNHHEGNGLGSPILGQGHSQCMKCISALITLILLLQPRSYIREYSTKRIAGDRLKHVETKTDLCNFVHIYQNLLIAHVNLRDSYVPLVPSGHQGSHIHCHCQKSTEMSHISSVSHFLTLFKSIQWAHNLCANDRWSLQVLQLSCTGLKA